MILYVVRIYVTTALVVCNIFRVTNEISSFKTPAVFDHNVSFSIVSQRLRFFMFNNFVS
jgi:hypothetical protein